MQKSIVSVKKLAGEIKSLKELIGKPAAPAVAKADDSSLMDIDSSIPTETEEAGPSATKKIKKNIKEEQMPKAIVSFHFTSSHSLQCMISFFSARKSLQRKSHKTNKKVNFCQCT